MRGLAWAAIIAYDPPVAVHQETIEVRTTARGLSDVTRAVQAVVDGSKIGVGLCTVFVQHTSASLVIQENADRNVLVDLAEWMGELAPESRRWRHAEEGPDDMPAHIKAAWGAVSLSIPVTDGRPALGTWQGIYLFEHRDRGQTRRVVGQLNA